MFWRKNIEPKRDHDNLRKIIREHGCGLLQMYPRLFYPPIRKIRVLSYQDAVFNSHLWHNLLMFCIGKSMCFLA